MNQISVKIIEASKVTTDDTEVKLLTLELEYHRYIHSEVMTHRTFCISGDARLDFDMPSGKARKVHSMTLREFHDKWHNGSAEGRSSRHNGRFLDLDASGVYSAAAIAEKLGFVKHLNLNTVCREGLVKGAWKSEDGTWLATGASWSTWREGTGQRRFGLRSRLEKMRIRQVDERTGEVRLSSVKACISSGVKQVYRVTTEGYSTVATADHRFLTQAGWKRLGDIVIGVDSLLTYSVRKPDAEHLGDRFKKLDGKWVSTWIKQVKSCVVKRQGGLCWVSGEPLEPGFHIHHVTPKHVDPSRAFDVTNVVAVNEAGHRKLHAKQGWQESRPLGTSLSKVICISDAGSVDTYDLEIAGEFENFFADGIVVHNSRNASSSRAIPVKKVIAQVWSNPAMPVHWGKNQPGMQASEQLTGWRMHTAKALWRGLAKVAAATAWGFSKVGLAKQVANRILEPWQLIRVIYTATEWDNFFALRNHPDAQPEFRVLAALMEEAYNTAEFRELGTDTSCADGWHLPYISRHERTDGKYIPHHLAKLSTARCARVSYLTHDKRTPTGAEDLALFERLMGSHPRHASPSEHQAHRPLHGIPEGFASNLKGVIQFRKIVEASS